MFYLMPYKMASESARDLALYLNARRVKNTPDSKFKVSEDKVIINWGNSKVDKRFENANFINKPSAVAIASHKLKAFDALSDIEGVNIPPYTSDIEQARQWINDGELVVCRTVLKGHSGEGIVIASSLEELVEAPLYTLYLKKKEEYRLHYINGLVQDITRKARSRDFMDEDVNWRVRNLAGGFIYSRDLQNHLLDDQPYNMVERTIEALGLDFGAVDLIWNKKQNKYTVLEVNCAPGLSGTTLSIYSRDLSRMVENRKNTMPTKILFNKMEYRSFDNLGETPAPVEETPAPLGEPLFDFADTINMSKVKKAPFKKKKKVYYTEAVAQSIKSFLSKHNRLPHGVSVDNDGRFYKRNIF